MPREVLEWRTRTWYGVPVRVLVSSENVHEVWVAGIPLPHVGLVNGITRQGLPTQWRLELTARHEVGHVQTAPLALGFLAALVGWLHRSRGRGFWTWPRALGVLVAQHLLWEMLAEAYVLLTDARARWPQRPRWAQRLYRSFWWGMAAGLLGLLGWLFRQGAKE